MFSAFYISRSTAKLSVHGAKSSPKSRDIFDSASPT